jgi:7-carboxy-7-deazaguanine synthase
MRLNTQPREAVLRDHDGKTLEIVGSPWETIQGEGPFTGSPAVFIRLAGCNMNCPGCDTDYTSNRETLTYVQIVDRVMDLRQSDKHTCRLVVITGGEPLRQNIALLCSQLISMDYTPQIETSGTVTVGVPQLEDLKRQHGGKLTIVCSPKAPTVAPPLVPLIDAYKYVMGYLSVSHDGLPFDVLCAGITPARPPAVFPRERVWLQPMDTGDKDADALNLKACVESCLKHGWTLGVQLHKLIGMP